MNPFISECAALTTGLPCSSSTTVATSETMPHQYASDEVLSTASVHAKLQSDTTRNNTTHRSGLIRFHFHARASPTDANITAPSSSKPTTTLASGPVRGSAPITRTKNSVNTHRSDR